MKKYIALCLLFQISLQASPCLSWERFFDSYPSLDKNPERQLSLALQHLRGQKYLPPYSHSAPYPSSIVFQHLNRTLELDPHNVEALRLRGILSFERGSSIEKDNAQKTIRDLRKVVQLSPEDTDSRYLFSLSLLRYSRKSPQGLEEAISHLSIIIEANTQNVGNAYLARGVTHFFLGDYFLAVEDIDKSLKLFSHEDMAPIEGRILFYRGMSRLAVDTANVGVKDLLSSIKSGLSRSESHNIMDTLFIRNTHNQALLARDFDNSHKKGLRKRMRETLLLLEDMETSYGHFILAVASSPEASLSLERLASTLSFQHLPKIEEAIAAMKNNVDETIRSATNLPFIGQMRLRSYALGVGKMYMGDIDSAHNEFIRIMEGLPEQLLGQLLDHTFPRIYRYGFTHLQFPKG